MATAWVDLLSCQEIAQKIGASLDYLSTSMRDVPERHRSLRATFDHSWKLFPYNERRKLGNLTISHGGFSHQAAEQITGASLTLLASLHTKFLVRRT